MFDSSVAPFSKSRLPLSLPFFHGSAVSLACRFSVAVPFNGPFFEQQDDFRIFNSNLSFDFAVQ